MANSHACIINWNTNKIADCYFIIRVPKSHQSYIDYVHTRVSITRGGLGSIMFFCQMSNYYEVSLLGSNQTK